MVLTSCSPVLFLFSLLVLVEDALNMTFRPFTCGSAENLSTPTTAGGKYPHMDLATVEAWPDFGGDVQQALQVPENARVRITYQPQEEEDVKKPYNERQVEEFLAHMADSGKDIGLTR